MAEVHRGVVGTFEISGGHFVRVVDVDGLVMLEVNGQPAVAVACPEPDIEPSPEVVVWRRHIEGNTTVVLDPGGDGWSDEVQVREREWEDDLSDGEKRARWAGYRQGWDDAQEEVCDGS